MSVLDPLVLPPDVLVVPVAELPRELREEIGHGPDSYTVTRPRSRTQSSVVDPQTATLLQFFRTPATIIDAVIGFSAAEGVDPRATLDDAFELLCGFVADGVLVPAGSALADPIAAALAAGERVGDFEIVEAVHVVEDTEVYRARAADGAAVAVKLARPAAAAHVRAALRHEAEILERLDGSVNPRLLGLGEHDGEPFVAVAWCAGDDVFDAAAEARDLAGAAGRRALLALCESVVAAYARLHAQGVLHGDVHPRNVLVEPGGAVAIIDFGFAQIRGAPPGRRGGVDLFVDPALAATRLAGVPPPPLSAAAEQYSLAALLYYLLTGAHTHAFTLERAQTLGAIQRAPVLAFARHGVDLPAVERTIVRALAKEPRARHASVAAFARAFRAAAAEDLGRAGRPAAGEDLRRAGKPARPDASYRLLDDVVARLAAPGDLYARGLPAPTASVMNGAAGIAYALLRIAEIREDPSLLATADLWSSRAQLQARDAGGFANAALGIVPEVFGPSSFYHHAGGVACVHALIARARADDVARQLALDAFADVAAGSCEQADVAFGSAGLLLGCALALEGVSHRLQVAPLRAVGDRLRDDLLGRLDREPVLGEPGGELRSLGAAHGWAGYLFALLRWCAVTATPPPPGVVARLEQLAALGRPAGRGLRWPAKHGASAAGGLAAGWCNGAAGYVPLWTLAHALVCDERYAQLAERAAWTVNGGSVAGPGDLCCGFAGRAYALLSLYRHSGEAVWLARARRLADRAVTSIGAGSLRRDSLYKGEIGVALLLADLKDPEHARMPLYEAEGWPAGGQ